MKLEGTIPATLCPFRDDGQIDVEAYRSHLDDVVSAKGITAITVNGHASEVASCSFDEQRRILDVTLDHVGRQVPVISGIYSDDTQHAVELAQSANEAGASALLVFPSLVFQMGGHLKPDMALRHYGAIASATPLPLIVFQYPVASGLQLPMDTLLRMAEEIPAFQAMKDWCDDPRLHQEHIDTLQGLSRPINVLTTHSAWLLASLGMGPKGLLSGAGSVIAAEQVELFKYVEAGELNKARELDARLRPLIQAFYAPPFLDMHNRMKEALVLMGRLPNATVRAPLTPISDSERNRLRDALNSAGFSVTKPK